MSPRTAIAALAWSCLISLGNLSVSNVIRDPSLIIAPSRKPKLVLKAIDQRFEVSRSPAEGTTVMLQDGQVMANAPEVPMLPAPRTRRGWVDAVTWTPPPCVDQVQAGWFQGWSLEPGGALSTGPPAVEDGILFLAGGKWARSVYALDATTGIVLWVSRLSEPGPGAISTSPRHLAVASGVDAVYVLSTLDGRMVWSRRGEGRIEGDPIILDGRLLQGRELDDQHLIVARDLDTGELAWQALLQDQMILPPQISRDGLVLATRDGSVYCLDPETGAERWSESLGVTSPPRLDGARMYATCDNPWEGGDTAAGTGLLRITLSVGLPYERVVWAPREFKDRIRLVSSLSVGTGYSGIPAAGYPLLDAGRREGLRVEEELHEDRPPPLPAPWTAGDDVCMVTGKELRCVNLRSGSISWDWRPPQDQGAAGITLAPVLWRGILIAVSTRGDVVGLRSRDGAEVWTLRMDGNLIARPVVHDGWLYLVRADGRIFGLDLTGPMSRRTVETTLPSG